jgi:hypothetical protein
MGKDKEPEHEERESHEHSHEDPELRTRPVCDNGTERERNPDNEFRRANQIPAQKPRSRHDSPARTIRTPHAGQ